MGCSRPILAVDKGIVNMATGKTRYIFWRMDQDFDPRWSTVSRKKRSAPFSDSVVCAGDDPEAITPGGFPYKLIPCGKCVGCRMAYSKQWATRCMMELESHDSAYFVTLTYNDQFVPRSYFSDENGEAQLSLTLSRRDFQLFIKRLRFAFPNDNIRYFAAGEYGDNTWRPHYHAIIFGLHLNDLVPSGKSPEGFQYYYSPAFQRCWSQQVNLLGDRDKSVPYTEMGYALLSPVTWETSAYVARYTMKKLRGAEAKFYEKFALEPPFSAMSLKPGIGAEYLKNHPDAYQHQFLNLVTEKGGRQVMPPRYLDRLFEIDHPEQMAEIKAARERISKAAVAAKMERTTYTYLELLQAEENALMSRIKSLQRDSF